MIDTAYDEANAHIERLSSALQALLPYAEEHQDEGPDGEGWKSAKLRKAIDNANTALALLHL